MTAFNPLPSSLEINKRWFSGTISSVTRLFLTLSVVMSASPSPFLPAIARALPLLKIISELSPKMIFDLLPLLQLQILDTSPVPLVVLINY